mmetsp:Transcript_16512/g.55738  ORF Transcript_16512/g.55738 Transcript_16512/m.55738 type:complete len:253 (-) Transcript_16512:343-1101(-)
MAHAELVRKMLIPTAVGSDAPRDCWATYIDAASGARYVYNAKTGESKWSGTAVEQIRLQMAGHEDAPPDAPEPPTRPLELELVNLKSFKAARPKAPKARDDDFDFEDLDGADDDPLQLATEWRDRGMLRTVSTRKRVPLACHERCCDRLVLILEACFCESPFAILEAAFRAPAYLAASILLIALAAAVCLLRCCDCKRGSQLAKRAGLYAREGALFLAAAVTLLVPCAALLVYRGMPGDDGDWDVRGLHGTV